MLGSQSGFDTNCVDHAYINAKCSLVPPDGDDSRANGPSRWLNTAEYPLSPGNDEDLDRTQRTVLKLIATLPEGGGTNTRKNAE